jgi:hypothetical protein
MTMDLLPREVKLIELLRALPPRAAEEVADFAAYKASRVQTWSYDDPVACAAAWDRAASDPAFASEVQTIQREFAVTDGDGLSEDY